MAKTTKIENKVSIKLYGEQDLSQQIVKILEEHGFKAYGLVAQGNPYTTQKNQSGWASSITLFGPKRSKGSEESTSDTDD